MRNSIQGGPILADLKKIQDLAEILRHILSTATSADERMLAEISRAREAMVAAHKLAQ